MYSKPYYLKDIDAYQNSASHTNQYSILPN